MKALLLTAWRALCAFLSELDAVLSGDIGDDE